MRSKYLGVRGVSTISPCLSLKCTRVPGLMWTMARIFCGMTTWPFAPTMDDGNPRDAICISLDPIMLLEVMSRTKQLNIFSYDRRTPKRERNYVVKV